jgi:hypothetical protein
MISLYNVDVMSTEWAVDSTETYDRWFESLTEEEQDAVIAAVDVLEDRGPTLGRPLVDTIKQSRHKNMKELRPPAGDVRILFAFDPERKAILLLGGDKSGSWNKWYDKNVPVADHLFDQHVASLKEQRRPDG